MGGAAPATAPWQHTPPHQPAPMWAAPAPYIGVKLNKSGVVLPRPVPRILFLVSDLWPCVLCCGATCVSQRGTRVAGTPPRHTSLATRAASPLPHRGAAPHCCTHACTQGNTHTTTKALDTHTRLAHTPAWHTQGRRAWPHTGTRPHTTRAWNAMPCQKRAPVAQPPPPPHATPRATAPQGVCMHVPVNCVKQPKFEGTLRRRLPGHTRAFTRARAYPLPCPCSYPRRHTHGVLWYRRRHHNVNAGGENSGQCHCATVEIGLPW